MAGEDPKRVFLPAGREAPVRLVVDEGALDPEGRRILRRARVQNVIERCHARGQLTDRQAAAAELLQRDYAFGVLRASTDRGGSAWTPAGLSDAQLAACRRYREAMHILGPRLAPLVFDVVIEDRTVETVAALARKDRRGVVEVFRTALDILGDVYDVP